MWVFIIPSVACLRSYQGNNGPHLSKMILSELAVHLLFRCPTERTFSLCVAWSNLLSELYFKGLKVQIVPRLENALYWALDMLHFEHTRHCRKQRRRFLLRDRRWTQLFSSPWSLQAPRIFRLAYSYLMRLRRFVCRKWSVTCGSWQSNRWYVSK